MTKDETVDVSSLFHWTEFEQALGDSNIRGRLIL